jgi:hypothetical protein
LTTRTPGVVTPSLMGIAPIRPDKG